MTCDEGPEKNENGEILNHNCIECKDGYYFMVGTNDCYDNKINKKGYYLDFDEDPLLWKNCNINCKTCNKSGESINMNCITCINNLYLTLEGNCVSTCPNDTFTFKLNYTCLNSCPNNYEAKNDKNT